MIRARCVQSGLKFFEEPPKTEVHHQCLYIPRIPGHHDEKYGIYDCYGRLIPTAGPRRGWPNKALGQSQSCCVSPSPAFPLAPESKYFYGGHIGTHFGHFITETLPRYWCEQALEKDLKILVHSGDSLDYLFSLPWVFGFFELLGLCRDDFVVFNRPTRLASLVIAPAVFEENHFIHREFATFCNRIGQKAHLPHFDPCSAPKPVFLSRARYKSSLRQIVGEELMLGILERNNVNILLPEIMPVRKQVGIFASHRVVCGFIGSAFHNSIFSQAPQGIVLCHDEEYSSNYYLMDQANEASIAYIETPGLSLESASPGQPAVHRLHNPALTAEFLLEMIEKRIWEEPVEEISPVPPRDFDWQHPCLVKTYYNTYLCVERQTGRMMHKVKNAPGTISVMAFLSPSGWIEFTTTHGDCLTIARDQRQGSRVDYRHHENSGGTSNFFSPQTGRFLSALPDGQIVCDRTKPDLWEEFSFDDLL